MLPARSRLKAAADFRSVLRQGVKSGRRTVVVYLMQTGDAERMAGFAVSRAVGGAVQRNRVKRRLRAALAELLPNLPSGARVVVRALPDSASASYLKLRADVEAALTLAVKRAA